MPQVGRFELLGEVGDPRVLLEEMFAHVPVALQVYDVSGRSLLVNGAFVELFGAAPPPDYDVFKDEILERQGLSDLVRRAFAGETVRVPPHWYDPRELRHVQVKEGKRVAIEITLFPLRGPAGGVSHVVLCVKDVTSEFRLALSEARYRTQLEAAPEAVVTLDLETRRFVEANQKAVDLFGYPREELLTKNHLDVSPALQPDGRPSAEAAPDHLERVMRGDRPTFSIRRANCVRSSTPSAWRGSAPPS
jgi:PAS domain-containing protein